MNQDGSALYLDSSQQTSKPVDADRNQGRPLAYHVYNPNSKFRRTDPGPPDFCVVVTSFQVPASFDTLRELVMSLGGISLRVASVSDGGDVILYGVTDGCVPKIKNATYEN